MSEFENVWDLSVLDSPQSAPDVLGRNALASTVARGLVRSRPNESLITAVYGSWGSGKSWLKHRVLGELEAQKEAITVVEFSPWQIRGADELTIQFFAQIHEHLAPTTGSDLTGRQAKREKMWMALARLSGAGSAALKVIGGAAAMSDQGQMFAPALVAASGVSKHFAALLQTAAADVHAKGEKVRNPTSAEEARRELGKLFSEPGASSLLVVMDDFDRLTSDEIQTLIRLIKANVSFPGLNYLILCDPEQLASALDPIAANKGKEFLEKIVQNPIRLPSPNGESIFMQLAAGLQNIAGRTGYRIDEHETRLKIYFQNFLALGLRNLRSVYRLLEALEFSASALTKNDNLEVDLVDLLAIDFLRLHAPALADWLQGIRPSSYLFTGLRALFEEDKKQPLKDLLPQSIAESFGVDNSYSVLRTLFPTMAREFPAEEGFFQRSLRSLREPSKNYPLALSDDEHFDAYFQLQPNAFKIPESVYQATVAEGRDKQQLTRDLSEWIAAGWLPSALRRLRAEKEGFSKKQKANLFLALAEISDLLGRDDDPAAFEGELRSALRFLYDLLADFSEEERNALLDEVFASVAAFSARLMLLEDLRVRRSPELWKGREPREELPVLPQGRLDELQGSLAAAVNEEVRDRSFLVHPQQGFRIWRWVNALGPQATEALLRESMERESELVLLVIRGVARTMIGGFDMSFEDPASYAGSTSKGLLTSLCRFASEQFWREFLATSSAKFPPVTRPQPGDDCLMQHLRRALTPPPEDSPSSS